MESIVLGMYDHMYVIKRNGDRVPVSFNEVSTRIQRLAEGLPHVNPDLVSQKVCSQIHDGIKTSELDEFVMSLRSKDLLKIQGFFEDLPRVYADIKYTNRAGEEKEIRLEGMQSFFA